MIYAYVWFMQEPLENSLGIGEAHRQRSRKFMKYENRLDLYKDMEKRTDGEIYVGVVGPVRTGKSTFIKRFMQQLVLPNMKEEEKLRAIDEMPQSAAGKTIMTTEPKFVPKEAATIFLDESTQVKIRLIDCVGYLVEGAAGHKEAEGDRMVQTPWQTEEIPFEMAARIGTEKVIRDHATVGIVIFTDGSFGDLPVENYKKAEETTVKELKKLQKPFLILLNCAKPYSQEARRYGKELEEKYDARVLPVNCEQLREEHIHQIMEELLYEFPVSRMEIHLPDWTLLLDEEHELRETLRLQCLERLPRYERMRDIKSTPLEITGDFVKELLRKEIHMDDGTVLYELRLQESCYYAFLSYITGEQICSELQLLEALKEASVLKADYLRTKEALIEARERGYGVILPRREEIQLSEPQIIRQGKQYGVKLRAYSPSIHMIRANIETEIAPIVGSEEQAEDLIRYLNRSSAMQDGLWETKIFGKDVEDLVYDGITSKIKSIGEESQEKLQDSMEKIVNDNNGGFVCIII